MINKKEIPVKEYMEKRKRETARIHPQQAISRKNMIIDEAVELFGKDVGLSRERIEKLYMNEV